MDRSAPHISVCVCTFDRSDMLGKLLNALSRQVTEGKFSYSIVIADNDSRESARTTVGAFREKSPVPVRYAVEPEQNIALARNKAVATATGDMLAFIDDDELPESGWLLGMMSAISQFDVDGVLGPVRPYFVVEPPKWMVEARLFHRPEHPSGHVLRWHETRTGNALLKRSALDGIEGPFRREFGSGGEDRDFFRRAIEAGRVFAWCDVPVGEWIPVERTRSSFQLRRALLRGKASLSHPSSRGWGLLKSVVACFLYTLCLPIFLLFGRAVFMKYLIRNCDHIGKLLGACGIRPVHEKYVLK